MSDHPQARKAELQFSDTLDDMPGIVIDGDDAGSAFIAEQGAQLISWRDRDGNERLYLSPISGGLKRSDPAGNQAIRGGTPICFPQFSGRGQLPKHGLVRQMRWKVLPTAAGQDFRHAAALACTDDAASRAVWPQSFTAALRAQLLPSQLNISLTVTNTGGTPWDFTVALHTYFRVADVRNVRLRGLQGVSYQDATDDNKVVVQQDTDLTVARELDRVYMSPPKTLMLNEAGAAALQITQHGFQDSVVWNPGPVNAAALNDFPDDDWLHMICVEAACVVTPLRLEPGQSWSGSQTLTVLD
jgi:glucose-6-phosphate 1-epimerase